MSSASWLLVPVESVAIADLVATQPGLYFRGLLAAPEPVGGDEHPHVIEFRGVRYLEDGHHRTVRAALRGENRIWARVLRFEDMFGTLVRCVLR